MSLVTFTRTPGFQPLAYLRSVIGRVHWKPAINADGDNEGRERRDFVLEMMKSHPDAFQTDLDCQNVMQFYPSRF